MTYIMVNLGLQGKWTILGFVSRILRDGRVWLTLLLEL